MNKIIEHEMKKNNNIITTVQKIKTDLDVYCECKGNEFNIKIM